jgi:oligoribonuclease
VQHRDNLIWIDLEMTGLSTESDSIIEIATVVTDAQLHVLAEGPVFAIQTPEAMLLAMDEWNTRQHGASGLVQRIRSSDVNLLMAEERTLEFLRQWVPGGISPMCGNSICQDRRFLARQMPQLERYFHYRNLDVSTVKELARRWAPQLAAGFSKQASHLALADIHDSIRELQFYRQQLFVPAAQVSGAPDLGDMPA